MQINTLYQVLEEKDRMGDAATLLMIPDIINYLLTGKKVCERTNASTTQFYNPATHNWATELLERMDIRTDLLPELVDRVRHLVPLLKKSLKQPDFMAFRFTPWPATIPDQRLPLCLPRTATSPAGSGTVSSRRRDDRTTHEGL